MKITRFVIISSLFFVALGCGGAGGVSGGGSGGFFLTDGLDNHDHVWVTVKKAVLTGANGNVTIYNDAVGKTVDLKTLRDGSGERYAFLSTMPSGTYSAVTVTLDKKLVLFSGGSPVGQNRVFAGNNGSTVDLSLNLNSPKQFGPNNSFALDFHLGNWNDNGTTVSANQFLQEGQGNGLNDDNRQEQNDDGGTIQNLAGTAPNQTFNLVHDGQTVAVMTNAQTVLRNCGNYMPLSLANNVHVKVKGVFSTTSNAIVASSIQFENNDNDQPQVDGAASSIDGVAGTFVITLHDTDHFLPTATTVNVVTDANTVFTSQTGGVVTSTVFFAALTSGTRLQIEGTYDPITNIFTASRVHFEDENNEDGGNGGNTGGNTGGDTGGH